MANFTLTQTGQEVQDALNAVGKTVTYSITNFFTNSTKIQTILGAATTPGNNYLLAAFDLNPISSIADNVNTIIIDLTAVGVSGKLTFRKVYKGQFMLTLFAQSGTNISACNQFLLTAGYYGIISDLHTATII